MTRPHIYLQHPLMAGATYEISREQVHYLNHVLRLRHGDPVGVLDGCGGEFEGVIVKDQEGRLTVKVTGGVTSPPRGITITLAQALPKRNKLEIIIPKVVELGVHTVIPFETVRSVPRVGAEQTQHKHRRWTKIAVEAARQCGRADAPVIRPLETWEDVLQRGSGAALKLFFWEKEKEMDLKGLLRSGLSPFREGECFLIIGPEGGFTAEEAAMAESYGFRSVSLGRRLLKVDTAAVVVCTLLQYEIGVFFDVTAGSSGG